MLLLVCKEEIMDIQERVLLKKDRMRYEPNAISSQLALLGVIANVVFFISLYGINSDFMYDALIAISIVYNLAFMLVTILSSQAVKAYNRNYSIALIVIGLLQIVRIFIMPQRCFINEVATNSGYLVMVVSLAVSAAFLFASGIVGIIKSIEYKNYMASIDLKTA